jgi:hypothetical protein
MRPSDTPTTQDRAAAADGAVQRSITTRRLLIGGLGAAALPFLARTADARAATGPTVVTAPTSSDDNLVQPQSASVLPLSIQAASGQTANLTEWQDPQGAPLTAVEPNGDITMPRTGAGKGPFAWRVAGSTFNGRWNPTMSFGYNTGRKDSDAAGIPTVSGEPYAGFFVGSDYDDGTRRNMEMYLEFRSGDGVTNYRPWFFQVDRAATTPETFVTGSQIVGNPLTIGALRDGAGDQIQPTVNVAQFYANHTVLRAPVAGKPNLLSINAGPNQTSILRLGANDVARQWQLIAEPKRLDVNFLDTRSFSFYGAPRGAAGAAFAVGVEDNQAAGVFDTGPSANSLKGLVVRGKSTTSVNLVEIQDAARNVLGGYDRNGTWFTSRNAGPADADVKPGQMFMWFDPKTADLKIKGRDAAGAIRVGSVAAT